MKGGEVMSIGWMIYLIIKLDAISTVFFLSAASSFFFVLGLFFIPFTNWADNKGRYEKKAEYWKSICDKKYWKIPLVLFIVFLVLNILTPTTKEAVAIYTIPKIVANEDVQEIPGNAAKFLNTKLEQWINENVDIEIPTKGEEK